eukprot:11916209-Heterocapsa_arctica.AAC.1
MPRRGRPQGPFLPLPWPGGAPHVLTPRWTGGCPGPSREPRRWSSGAPDPGRRSSSAAALPRPQSAH